MIKQPMFYDEAVNLIVNKDPAPADWDSAMWSAEKPSVRVRAFMSANVESARLLDRMQGLLFDHLTGVRDEVTTPDGERTTAARVFDRAHFVRKVREFMMKEGMASADDFPGVNQNDITDIRSEERLRLIFDTNVRQAFGFGKWRQGMSPAVRKAFPACRFIRVRGVRLPRPRHMAHEGDVRLKTDIGYWARYQNDPEIGGFGVPWGPYGFRSGMDQTDVPRAEAKRLGLLKDEAEPNPKDLPGFNAGWSASVKGMDPDLKRKLIEKLRGGPQPKDPGELARSAAAKARLAAIGRRIDGAEARGDAAEAARLRSMIRGSATSPRVTLDGERIVLVDDMAERLAKVKKSSLSPAEKARARAELIFSKVDRRSAEPQRGRGLKNPPVRRALFTPELSLTTEEKWIIESPHEIALGYTAEGRLQRSNLGNRTSVRIPSGLPDDAIISHNHPGGRGPSGTDLGYLLRNPGQTLRVVTRNENGEIEIFQVSVTGGASKAEAARIVARYNERCLAGGDTPEARRSALDLIAEVTKDIMTFTRIIL